MAKALRNRLIASPDSSENAGNGRKRKNGAPKEPTESEASAHDPIDRDAETRTEGLELNPAVNQEQADAVEDSPHNLTVLSSPGAEPGCDEQQPAHVDSLRIDQPLGLPPLDQACATGRANVDTQCKQLLAERMDGSAELQPAAFFETPPTESMGDLGEPPPSALIDTQPTEGMDGVIEPLPTIYSNSRPTERKDGPTGPPTPSNDIPIETGRIQPARTESQSNTSTANPTLVLQNGETGADSPSRSPSPHQNDDPVDRVIQSESGAQVFNADAKQPPVEQRKVDPAPGFHILPGRERQSHSARTVMEVLADEQIPALAAQIRNPVEAQVASTLLSLHQPSFFIAKDPGPLESQPAAEMPMSLLSHPTLHSGPTISRPTSPQSVGGSNLHATPPLTHPPPFPETFPALSADKPAVTDHEANVDHVVQSCALPSAETDRHLHLQAPPPSISIDTPHPDPDPARSEDLSPGPQLHNSSTRVIEPVTDPPEQSSNIPCPYVQHEVPRLRPVAEQRQEGAVPSLSSCFNTVLDQASDMFGSGLPRPEGIEAFLALRTPFTSQIPGIEPTGKPGAVEPMSDPCAMPQLEPMDIRDWLNFPNTPNTSGDEADAPHSGRDRKTAGPQTAEDRGRHTDLISNTATQSTQSSQVHHVAISSTSQYRQAIYTLMSQRCLSDGNRCVITITPLGASVSFYASPACWQMHIHRATTIPEASSKNFDRETFVDLLFRACVMFEQRLVHSLRDRENRRLARQAFRSEAGRTTMPEFMHGLLTLIVADRLSWVLGDPAPDSDDDRPLPEPRRKPTNLKDEPGLKKVVDQVLNWPDTLSDFLDLWGHYRSNRLHDVDKYQSDQNAQNRVPQVLGTQFIPYQQPTATVPDRALLSHVKSLAARLRPTTRPVLQNRPGPMDAPQVLTAGGTEACDAYETDLVATRKGSSVSTQVLPSPGTDGFLLYHDKAATVVSLFGGIEDSSNAMKIARVENNFCQAALGIFALTHREAVTRTWGPGDQIPSCADLLRRDFPGFPDSMKGVSDVIFLRPLYLAYCVSPFSILIRKGKSGSGIGKIGLSSILDAANFLVLHPHRQRRNIERDLMALIFDMATHGRDIFYINMEKTVDRWIEQGVIDNKLKLTANIEREKVRPVDMNARWNQLRSEGDPSLDVIEAISNSVEEPGCNLKTGQSIELTEAWIEEAVQNHVKHKERQRHEANQGATLGRPQVALPAPDSEEVRDRAVAQATDLALREPPALPRDGSLPGPFISEPIDSATDRAREPLSASPISRDSVSRNSPQPAPGMSLPKPVSEGCTGLRELRPLESVPGQTTIDSQLQQTTNGVQESEVGVGVNDDDRGIFVQSHDQPDSLLTPPTTGKRCRESVESPVSSPGAPKRRRLAKENLTVTDDAEHSPEELSRLTLMRQQRKQRNEWLRSRMPMYKPSTGREGISQADQYVTDDSETETQKSPVVAALLRSLHKKTSRVDGESATEFIDLTDDDHTPLARNGAGFVLPALAGTSNDTCTAALCPTIAHEPRETSCAASGQDIPLRRNRQEDQAHGLYDDRQVKRLRGNHVQLAIRRAWDASQTGRRDHSIGCRSISPTPQGHQSDQDIVLEHTANNEETETEDLGCPIKPASDAEEKADTGGDEVGNLEQAVSDGEDADAEGDEEANLEQAVSDEEEEEAQPEQDRQLEQADSDGEEADVARSEEGNLDEATSDAEEEEAEPEQGTHVHQTDSDGEEEADVDGDVDRAEEGNLDEAASDEENEEAEPEQGTHVHQTVSDGETSDRSKDESRRDQEQEAPGDEDADGEVDPELDKQNAASSETDDDSESGGGNSRPSQRRSRQAAFRRRRARRPVRHPSDSTQQLPGSSRPLELALSRKPRTGRSTRSSVSRKSKKGKSRGSGRRVVLEEPEVCKVPKDVDFTHNLDDLYETDVCEPSEELVSLQFFEPCRRDTTNGESGGPKDLQAIEKNVYDKGDFQLLEYDWLVWPSMDEDVEEVSNFMQFVREPTSDSVSDPDGVGSTVLQTVSRQYWESLQLPEKNSMLKKGPIHIVGPASAPPHGIKGVSDPKLKNLVDFDGVYQCKDLTVPREQEDDHWTHHRKVTLRDFMQEVRRRAETSEAVGVPRRCCNVLDIPLLHNCLPLELDHFSKYASSNFSTWNPNTDLGLTSLASQWALAAHAGALSQMHIDAGGLATDVHLVSGKKAWWVASRGSTFATEKGFESEMLEVDCAVLSAGDELIMPPGTPHAVLTLEDSFALGGHFYNYGTMLETGKAMVQEHYFGTSLTNTEHPRAPILLMKGFAALTHGTFQPEYPEDDGTEPSQQDFAALAVVVSNIEHLPPEIPDDSNTGIWHDSSQFKTDVSVVAEMVKEFMVSHMKSKGLLQAINWAELNLLEWIQMHEDRKAKRTVFKSLLNAENRASLGLVEGR